MRRALPALLLAAGVGCAALGTALLGASAPADTGWTAYSPLSHEIYRPGTVPAWQHPTGEALLALGAGTSGGAVTAVVLSSRRRRTAEAID